MKFLLLFTLMLYSLIIDGQRHGYSTEQRQIDSLLRTFYRNDEPGASIAVLKNGRLFKFNYGLMDLDSREKISSTTNFNIGSLTKQFTATAILQLMEKKKLALDNKIGNFFPGLNKKIGRTITVRQLLTHSSGIIDHYDYADKNLKHAHDSDVLAAISNIDSTLFCARHWISLQQRRILPAGADHRKVEWFVLFGLCDKKHFSTLENV